MLPTRTTMAAALVVDRVAIALPLLGDEEKREDDEKGNDHHNDPSIDGEYDYPSNFLPNDSYDFNLNSGQKLDLVLTPKPGKGNGNTILKKLNIMRHKFSIQKRCAGQLLFIN